MSLPGSVLFTSVASDGKEIKWRLLPAQTTAELPEGDTLMSKIAFDPVDLSEITA